METSKASPFDDRTNALLYLPAALPDMPVVGSIDEVRWFILSKKNESYFE